MMAVHINTDGYIW